MQLELQAATNGQRIRKTLEYLPVAALAHSRFNTRKTRERPAVERLAERMRRNGFELTRAPWAQAGEVFAGGTRLEAARLAGLSKIPVIVHVGLNEDEIARLADEDNENDEYHARVSLLDTWAEYHRLAKDEGWTLERIARAKGDLTEGGDPRTSLVSERVTWHDRMSGDARAAVSNGLFDEGHIRELSGVVLTLETLAPWLTTAAAQAGVVAEVLGKHRGSTSGIKPTVANVRETARRWKDMIAAAVEAHSNLEGDGGAWQRAFVEALASAEARSLAAVNFAAKGALDAKAKAAADAARKATDAEKKANADAARAARIAALTACIVHGDAREKMPGAPDGIALLLTDPPYGQDFQSGRRVGTPKKARIAGDNEDAFALLADVLRVAVPKMADDSTALIFTGWRHEPEFRAVIEAAGLVIKGSLVWVKNNHGTGDLKGAFAPRHERIIHAVKGSPTLRRRIDDVLFGKDAQDSAHPTEKPRDLLRALIEATTDQGDAVVDPFAGHGSALFEAHSLGRVFWGCELDEGFHREIADAVVELASQAP